MFGEFHPRQENGVYPNWASWKSWWSTTRIWWFSQNFQTKPDLKTPSVFQPHLFRSSSLGWAGVWATASGRRLRQRNDAWAGTEHRHFRSCAQDGNQFGMGNLQTRCCQHPSCIWDVLRASNRAIGRGPGLSAKPPTRPIYGIDFVFLSIKKQYR